MGLLSVGGATNSLACRFFICVIIIKITYDMVWMEKMIGGHPDTPADFVPFSRLPVQDR